MSPLDPQDTQESGLLRNPPSGTLIPVLAGGCSALEFEFRNDSPDLASFRLEVTGVPAEWVVGAGSDSAQVVPPSGSGVLAVSLKPDAQAAAGEHDLGVRLLSSEGEVLMETALVLHILSAAGPEGLPAPRVPDAVAAPGEGWADAAGADEFLQVDLGTEGAAYEEEGAGAPEEPAVTDPPDGRVIAVRPGETLLVRFTCVNEARQERTYNLDVNEGLESGWVSLVQDQVNLTRNGAGELSLRLTPPAKARPGEYPFEVVYGVQGQPLTRRTLFLKVAPTPAVQLRAVADVVRMGPFRRAARFALQVESAGNADTAFRVAALKDAPDVAEGPSGEENGIERWTHDFDQEFDNLESPSPTLPPRPVTLSLLARPRGIWWWGLRQVHRLRVAAVPVTHPDNGGVPGNVLSLTVRRWRVLPFPLVLFAPLLLAVIVPLSGGPYSLDVTNSIYKTRGSDTTGPETWFYWVMAPPNMTTETSTAKVYVQWTAARAAWLNMTVNEIDSSVPKEPVSKIYMGPGYIECQTRVGSNDRHAIMNLTLSRQFGSLSRDAYVHVVYTRTDTPWIAYNESYGARDRITPIEREPVVRTEPTRLDFRVPSGDGEVGRLTFYNEASEYLYVNYWLVRQLSPKSRYRVEYVVPEGSARSWDRRHIKIVRNPHGSSTLPEDNTLTVVSTDAYHPVYQIRLVDGRPLTPDEKAAVEYHQRVVTEGVKQGASALRKEWP